MRVGFKCHKCKGFTRGQDLRFVYFPKEHTKYGFCPECFERRQKWRKQRGLPIESGR